MFVIGSATQGHMCVAVFAEHYADKVFSLLFLALALCRRRNFARNYRTDRFVGYESYNTVNSRLHIKSRFFESKAITEVPKPSTIPSPTRKSAQLSAIWLLILHSVHWALQRFTIIVTCRTKLFLFIISISPYRWLIPSPAQPGTHRYQLSSMFGGTCLLKLSQGPERYM